MTRQQGKNAIVQASRVDLDGELRIGLEREGLLQDGHQPLELRVGQESRRPAAKVQLADFRLRVELGAHKRDLAFEVIKVDIGATAILGRNLVTGTVIANRIAERQVYVERKSGARALRLARVQRVEVVLYGVALGKPVGSRVRRVPWAAAVMPRDEFGVEFDGTDMGYMHHAQPSEYPECWCR